MAEGILTDFLGEFIKINIVMLDSLGTFILGIKSPVLSCQLCPAFELFQLGLKHCGAETSHFFYVPFPIS